MLLYILKFSICLAIFLAFYKFFLEKQSMHVFKRFYLLGALVIALSIPLITFTSYVYVEPASVSEKVSPIISEVFINHQPNDTLTINYWPYILWSIYGLGVLIFSIRFIRNLYRLIYKISHNIKCIQTKTTNVLLKENITPHTFLRYIFFNKQKFEAKAIPQEVFWHEETHAIQKHSLDVLFVELLQIVFWFNPLIYLIKRSVKLNHEFLADQGVLNRGVLLNTYQQLLLEFSSKQSEHELANAINYSLIKKRFTIMKTQTSKRNFWLRSLILLPVLAFTLYSFSNKVEVEKSMSEDNKLKLESNSFEEIVLEKNDESKEKFLIYVNHKGQYIVDRVDLTLKSIKNEIDKLPNKELELRVKYSSPLKKVKDLLELLSNIDGLKVNPFIYHQVTKDISTKKAQEINALLNTIGELKIIPINISAPKLKVTGYENIKYKLINDIKNKQQELKPSSFQEKVTPEEITDYNTWAKELQNDIIEANKENRYVGVIKTRVLEKYKRIYIIMTPEQRENAVDFPDYTLPVFTSVKQNKELQNKATPEQIKEYNEIARKINKEIANKHPIIKVKDIERVKYIHSLMSNSQKNNSEKLPNFSAIPIHIPTPANLQDKATPEQIKEYNKLAKHYNNLPKDKLVIKLKDMTRIRELYNLMSDAQKKKAEPLPNFPPPPPPTRNGPKQKDYLLKGISYPAPLPDNATTQEKRNYEKAVEDYKNQGYGYKYEDKGREITVIISDVAPPPPPVVKRPPPPPPVKKSKNEAETPLPNKEISDWKYVEKELKEERLALNQLIKEKYEQFEKDEKIDEKELEELHDQFREKREEIEQKERQLYDESFKSRKQRAEASKQKKELIFKERAKYNEQRKAAQKERQGLVKEKKEEREAVLKQREALIIEERAAYNKQRKAAQKEREALRLETRKAFEEDRKIIQEKVLKQIKEQKEARDQKRKTLKKERERVIKEQKAKSKKEKQKEGEEYEVLVFEEEINKDVEQIIKEQQEEEEKEIRSKKIQELKEMIDITDKSQSNNFQDSRLKNIDQKVTNDYIKRFPESVSKVKAGDELVNMYEIPVYDFVKINNTVYLEMPTKKGNLYYDKQGNPVDFKDQIIEVENIIKEEFIKNL